jgi:hypothetical protein
MKDVAYIRSRSSRYPAAMDIELSWTLEVLGDDRLVELSPYPNSRVGASGFIGFSPSAGKVLVVIAYRDLDGDLAWRERMAGNRPRSVHVPGGG